MNMQQPEQSPFWRTTTRFAAFGFGAVAAFFLFTEHRAHLFGWLPYLLLLCCPVMMLFMHHGHDEHQDSSPGKPELPVKKGSTSA
jgi:peptidoglycan/LPS O-acetylase OafA/YrhL